MIIAKVSDKLRIREHELLPTARKDFRIDPSYKVGLGDITVYEGTTQSLTEFSYDGPITKNSMVVVMFAQYASTAGPTPGLLNGQSNSYGQAYTYGNCRLTLTTFTIKYPGPFSHYYLLNADATTNKWRAIFATIHGVEQENYDRIPILGADTGLDPSVTFADSEDGALGLAICMSNTSGNAATSSTTGGQVAIEDSSGGDYGAYKWFTGTSGTMTFTDSTAVMGAFLFQPSRFKRKIMP